MSNFGVLMDRVVAAAQGAVTGLVAERANALVKNVALDDFPHLFVYNASDRIERAGHKQKLVTTTIIARLVTRDETQEALFLKRDAIRDAIEADATLLSLTTDVLVDATDTEEDPASQDKFAEMTITTQQEL